MTQRKNTRRRRNMGGGRPTVPLEALQITSVHDINFFLHLYEYVKMDDENYLKKQSLASVQNVKSLIEAYDEIQENKNNDDIRKAINFLSSPVREAIKYISSRAQIAPNGGRRKSKKYRKSKKSKKSRRHRKRT